MSDLPIPDWLGVSTASFLSTTEDTTDTLDPRSLLPDDQFVDNTPLYNDGSNGNPGNDPNALFSDPLLYEDPSLPFEIDMHPPALPQRQPTNQIPSFPATSSLGLQNVYEGCAFLGENVQSESAPGIVSPTGVCHPTKLAIHDHGPASDHATATVTSNGPACPAQKTRKRHVFIRSRLSNGGRLKLELTFSPCRSYVDADSLKCDWPGCKRRQPFKRPQVLRRHRKTIHESPGSFVCHYDGCHKTKNRKDNLLEHIRQHHQKAMSADESSRGS
ncbi:hypothetical protein IFM61606_10778 [Aspergillus udagawae]|uniref:C2H2-type domain-containing protein n=1 Tax=Aspergillus udagawae TaxID=91492 RepID=A0ABQ1APD0_9EURO|nr:hypothetical protein IFM61606_10778 [Aspergillus udagawae]GFF85613.1 hypothetical protein IFM53868_04538 [Aspergillus udagawae]